MRLKLLISCSFLLSTLSITTHASLVEDLLNSDGPLGNAARQIKSSHQSSGKIGSIVPSKSKEECYDQLHDLYYSWFSDIEVGEIYSAIYSRTKLTIENIEGEINLDQDKDYFYGLSSSKGIKVNSYSSNTAIHLSANCKDYITLNESQIKFIDMPYPNFEKGKRNGTVNVQNKECRITNASIDDLAYEIIACPGDNSIYTRYYNY